MLRATMQQLLLRRRYCATYLSSYLALAIRLAITGESQRASAAAAEGAQRRHEGFDLRLCVVHMRRHPQAVHAPAALVGRAAAGEAGVD